MILPSDDSLILDADDDGPMVVDRSNHPAISLTALQALLPAHRRVGVSLVRDAMLSAWGSMAQLHWARSAFVLDAQASPMAAAGDQLDAWGDVLKRPRVRDEQDPAYRLRLTGPASSITPVNIKAILDQLIFALFQGTQLGVYNEPLIDAAYIGPATASDPVNRNSNNDPTTTSYAGQAHGAVAPWQAWVQSTSARLWANYPDRPYPAFPHTGAWVVPASGGTLWIILPGDAGDDSVTPHCMPPATASTGAAGFDAWDYLTPSSAPANWTTAYLAPAAGTLLEQIRSEVDKRKAAGVGWMAWIDPLLAAAH